MICPFCKKKLVYFGKNSEISIKKKFYVCSVCHTLFERQTIRNEIGLVKSDDFYQLNEMGEYVKNF